jgi:O-antigen/teichoic acid export membrane protein
LSARERVSRITSNHVLRSIGGVSGAAIFAQVVGLAVSPVTSRLFAQADFGRFGLFFGLANVLATVSLLGFTDAVLAPPDEDDATALLAAGLWTVLLSLPVVVLATAILVQWGMFGYGALPWWCIPLMGLEVGAIGVVMMLQSWTIRRRRFRALAKGHAALGAVRGIGQIGGGVVGSGFLGLALAEIVSRAVVGWILVLATADDLRKARMQARATIARVAWRYRHFPMFRTPSTFANNVGSAMPGALVAMAYGVESAGLYTLMATVIVAPSSLVQKAVGDVFLGHFAERYRTDQAAARRFLFRVMLALASFSIVPALVLWGWGPELFAVLFGDRWRTAGHLAAIMAPLVMADLSVGPLGGTLSVANRPDAKLIFDVVRLGGLAAAYGIATRASAPLESMVRLFAIFGVISYLVYAVLIYFGTRHPRPSTVPTTDLPAR